MLLLDSEGGGKEERKVLHVGYIGMYVAINDPNEPKFSISFFGLIKMKRKRTKRSYRNENTFHFRNRYGGTFCF